MADWSLPTLTSTYANFLSQLQTRDTDLAVQFDGTSTSNQPTGTIRWDSTAGRWKRWTGTAWDELAATYALTGLSTTGNTSVGGTLTVTGATTLTGGGTSTTPATDNNTTAIATTAFVVGQAAATAPVMNGTAAVGTSLRYARQDHVHPTDITVAPLASPALTGTPTAPTASIGTNTTQIATTAFVLANNLTKSGGTFDGDITTPSLNSGSLAGTRSRIINGGMQIDQRNNGSSISSGVSAVTYTVDRWYVYATGAAVSAQRVASSSSDFTSALRIVGATSNTGIVIGQRIEAQNSYDLAGKSVALSFYAASSASVMLVFSVYYAGTANNFTTKTLIQNGTAIPSSTLQKFYVPLSPFPSSATTGLAVEFSVASLTSGSIDITGVQLEPGSLATPFERRSFEQELSLAQRYFAAIPTGVPPSSWNPTPLSYPVTMRDVPTISNGGSGYTTQRITTNNLYHNQTSFGTQTIFANAEL